MKDLTPSEKAQLLGKIKSFLSITWNDTEYDVSLWNYAVSSMRRIDEVAGEELDYLYENGTYTSETYLDMCAAGRDLLLNRIFYMNEKALDDFETNYRGEITRLYLMGKVYADAEQS